MKKNISRKLSKATILLVAFVALTMVFTIYQTSINNTINNVATELTHDSDKTLIDIIDFAEAATAINSDGSQLVDGWTYNKSWGEATQTHDFTTYYYLPENYARATYGGCITYSGYGYLKGACWSRTQTYYIIGEDSGGNWLCDISASGSSDKQDVWASSETASNGVVRFRARTVLKSAASGDARYENIRVYCYYGGDSSAPTISGGDWQINNNAITITDNTAGINTIVVEYCPPDSSTFTKQNSLSWAASGTNRTTTKDVVFPARQYGQYRIVATDNLGNTSAAKVIDYRNPVVNIKSNPTAFGLVDLHKTSNYTLNTANTSVTIKGNTYEDYTLVEGSAYYLYAGANTNYYFTGFEALSGQPTGTLSYFQQIGDFYVWRQDETIPSSPTGNIFNWQANFSPIYNALEYLGADGSYKSFNASTSSWAFDYNGSARAPLQTKSGYYATFAYTGTTLGGTTYSSSTAPTYAGSYTVTVTMRMGSTSGNPTGKATYSFTINPVNIVAKPGIADKIYDRTTLAIQSNNTGTTANATLWTYSIYDSTLSKTASTNDGTLTLTTNADIEFHFAKSSVGSTTIDIYQKNTDGTTTKLTTTNVNPFNSDALDFYFTGSATTDKVYTNNPVATITSTNNNLIKSYIVRTTTSNISKTIYPAPLTVKLGNYVNYNTTALPSTIYVGGKAFTDHGYIGKIYDGTNNHYIGGLVIEGIIPGDNITISKKSGTGVNILATVISNEGTGHYACVLANNGNPTTKTITTEELSLGANVVNYYVKTPDGGTLGNESTPYSTQTKFQLTMGGIVIAQRPISIEIKPASTIIEKFYDGTTALRNEVVTASVKEDSLQFVKDGSNADEVTILSANAEVYFNNANANYNGNTMFGADTTKEITARGYSIVDSNKTTTTIAANYHLVSQPASISSSTDFRIRTRPISVNVFVNDKAYDGTTTAVGNLTWSYIVGETDSVIDLADANYSDSNISLSISSNPAFESPNAGTYNDLSVVVSLAGSTSANYSLVGDPSASGSYSPNNTTDPKTITVSNLTAIINPLEIGDTSITKVMSDSATRGGVPLFDATNATYNYDTKSHVPVVTIVNTTFANSTDTSIQALASLVSGTDYTIPTYENINAGTYTITITGKGNYTGTATLTYKILPAKVKVNVNTSYTWQSKDGEHLLSYVKDGKIYVIYGVDHFTYDSISYSHPSFNLAAGEADATNRLFVTTNANNGTYDSDSSIVNDILVGNWSYSGTQNTIYELGEHKIDIAFNKTKDSTYYDNYDLEATEGVQVTVVVERRPISLVIKDQTTMTFGEAVNFKSSYSEEQPFTLKEGSLGIVTSKTEMADFGTLSCEIVNKQYPAIVEDFVFYNKTYAQINNSDLLMAGNYAIVPKFDYTKDSDDSTKSIIDNYIVTWYNAQGEIISEDGTTSTNTATFTVNQRPISLTANALNKVYGETDPAFTYTATNLVVGNLQLLLVGALGRDEGEGVRSYNYTAGTLKPEAKASYTVDEYSIYYNIINYKFENSEGNNTFDITTNTFTITEKSIYFDLSGYTETSIFGDDIEIINNYVLTDGTDETKTGESAVLGNSDTIKDDFPQLKIVRTDATTGTDATETITVGSYNLSLYYSDKLTGEWVKVPTEKAQETNKLNANYMAYATQGSWEIQKRPVVVTPNLTNTQKVYSAKDPAAITAPTSYTTTYNGDSSKPGAIDGYPINGSLGREAGEDVLIEENSYGKYLFTQGTVKNDINPNYTITFANPDNLGLTIMPLQVELMPTDTRKATEVLNAVTYPELTDLASYEQYEASLAEKAGRLRISFTASPVAVQNQYDESAIYDLGLVVDSTGIKNKIISIGGGFVLPKEYEFTYVDGGNTLTKTNAYPTTVGLYDLKLNNVTDGPEFNNYIFTVRQIEALGSFEVQPLRALIVPDADQSIVYGQDVPTITYKAYDPNDLSSVIDNSNFEGALRVNGTLNSDGYLNVGNQYAIVNDNLTSANYKVEFGDTVYFKVTPKPVTVSLNGVDSSNTIKIIYGNASPLIPLLDANTEGDSFYPYTFSLNGLVPSKATNDIDYSSFAYSFAKKVALSDNGQVITLGTLEQANANYTYTFDKTYKLQITARPITITPIAGLSQQFGDGMSGDVSNSSSYTTSYNALAQANNGEEFTVIDNLSQINMSSIISLSKEAGTDYWMIRIAGMKQATHLVTSADEKVTELGGTLYAYEDGELLFTFKFDKHSNNNPYFIITSSDAVGSREYDGTAYDYYLTRRSLLPGDNITGQLSVDYGTYSDNTAPIGEYGYNLGTLSANNYDLTLDTNSPKYTVVVRPLEIKLTGTINITFGDTVTSVENYALFEADGETESYYQLAIPFILPTGTLIPGYYPINVDIAQSNTTHSNFTFSFKAEDYTEYLIISKRTITLTPAVGQSKMYMEELPALTYATTGEFVEGYVPANEAFNLSIVGITSEQEAKMARTGTHNYQFNINNDYVLKDGVVLSDCYNIITALEDANGQAITFSVYRATTTITIPDAVATDETNRNFALTLTYNGNAQTIVPELGTGRYDADGTEIGHIEYFDEDGMPIDELSFKDAGSYLVEVYANVDTTKFTEKSVFLTINIKKYALAEVDPTDENYGLALEKIYGEADGNLEFQIDGIGTDGKLSASLKREEGENVGSYDITEIIFVNSNYEVSFKDCSYEIKAKALEITPNNIENSTKIYGEADGELYEDIAGVNDETLRVIYSRSAGENVGKYDVAFSKVIKLTTDEFGAIVPVKDEFGNYVENANYSVTLADGTGTEKYEITKRKATVTAVSVQKVFDSIAVDLDSLSYNTENVVSGETLVGSITILTGAPVEAGTYAIVLEGFNEAPENSNYDITLVNATCVISPAPISIKAVSVTYEYGDIIADFDYEVSGTVYAGYPLEGKLALGANNQIVSGTLNNNDGRNPNYKITYLSGGVCTITPRHITVTVTASVEQVYGDELTAIPYAVTSANGLADGDEALLGSLAPSGKDVNLAGYTIEMGTLQELNPNYLITLETADHKYIITPRPISVTVEPKTSVYGDEPIALKYTAEGLIGEDTLNGELYCDLGTDAKSYPITQGTLNHPNYEITTFNGADYTITPRAIVVTIKDAESDFGQEIAELEWYISKGRLIGQDDLGIVLTKAEGTTMGTYEITGSFNNDNYTVEFVNGTYTIHKYQAVITVANQFITFIEDGDARSIQAECSSGAEIIFTVKGEEVSNYFREAGKYTVELTAPETDNYYAPEEVIVYITINRPVLKTEANGIDVTLTNENGFDPNLSIEMEKLPTDYMDMIAELTSKQKIVRAFTLTSINEDTLIEEVEGKTTVTIKVPTMLSEQETVQVLVREDGEYDIIEVEVLDGYVTLEVDSLSSFAFITEENTNYLLLILIGVAALIMLGSVMVFLFRKRA